LSISWNAGGVKTGGSLHEPAGGAEDFAVGDRNLILTPDLSDGASAIGSPLSDQFARDLFRADISSTRGTSAFTGCALPLDMKSAASERCS
jgi:hypothetical protein